MKNDTKNIKKILESADAYLIFTDKGCAVNGSTPALLAIYATLTKEMMNLKGMDKEKLDLAYELAFMSDKEMLQKISKTLEEIVDKIK